MFYGIRIQFFDAMCVAKSYFVPTCLAVVCDFGFVAALLRVSLVNCCHA